MKRIINGRLYDDSFMRSIGSRSFYQTDLVTGEQISYHEELKREYVLKPGHTLADTWVVGKYGSREIVQDNCDLTKGQFVLKLTQGWSNGKFIPYSDEEARAWLEKWCPDNTGIYEEIFGPAENPWAKDGTVSLVEQADNRVASMKWDKERAEERANKAEAEIVQLKEKLAALSNPVTAGQGFDPEA